MFLSRKWATGLRKTHYVFTGGSFVTFLVLLILLLVIQGVDVLRIEGAEPEKIDVFTSKTGGYKCYRIPSLICAPNGVLLAFCEGRKENCKDESPTDLVLKRSLDGGKSWLAMQVVVEAVPEAALNPTVIIDRQTRIILLIYSRWPASGQRLPGFGPESVTMWLTASSDDGATWSKPVDITSMTKKADWRQVFPGPGVGIQARTGRLIIPCSMNSSESRLENWWNYVIYSDDHGKSWHISDNVIGPGVDESQVVELTDGTLLLNMRAAFGKGCRFSARSTDGGKTWSEMSAIRELSDPTCHASILRYTWADEGGKSRILFCNPGGSPGKRIGEGREAGTVRISYDEGETWPVSKVLEKGYFGYCCLTVMPDGTLACLYESEKIRKLTFARFTMDWLTDDKDCPK